MVHIAQLIGFQWRFLIYSALLILEYHTLTRPRQFGLLSGVLNPILGLYGQAPLLQFQFLMLARKVTLTIFIAFSQLGPLLAMQKTAATSSKLDSTQLQRLEEAARASHVEANRLFALDMAPLGKDEDAVKDLKRKVTSWLVENTICADPMVKDAVGTALRRRQIEGPTAVT